MFTKRVATVTHIANQLTLLDVCSLLDNSLGHVCIPYILLQLGLRYLVEPVGQYPYLFCKLLRKGSQGHPPR